MTLNKDVSAIALSAAELTELASCETVIEHGLKIFQAVGVALITIREKRLYRADFKTFEAYCATKWGFTDRRARYLMRGAEVVGNLSKTGTMVPVLPAETPTMVGVLPTSERQVRPLIALPPEQQRAAWREAVESAPNGKVTGAHVEQVAQQYKPTTSRPAGVRASSEGVEPDLDEDGMPLVQHMDSAINDRLADIVELDEEEEDEGFRLGDIVEYRGQRCTVFGVSSAGRVSIKTSRGQPLVGIDPEREVITLIERAAKPGPLAEEIVQLDGVPVAESHPMGWQLFFIETSWATCVNCGESHPRWSFVRGGDWRCEHCKKLTHDDLLIPYTKADAVEERQRRSNGNGHKPSPLVTDPLPDDDSNDEWGTPEEWIVLARAFMRGIDTDPASNPAAQRIVRAKTFYTKQDDGLLHEWSGTVWLNPPYSHPLIERFTSEALRQYERGSFNESLILVNNQTGAAWFQQLLARANAVCFLKGRVNFVHPTKENPGNRQAQVLFYLGRRADDFVLEFSDKGVPMQCMWARAED